MTTPLRITPLFDALLSEKGSDLHLSIGYPPLARIHGELTPLREAPLTAPEVEGLLFELLAPEQKQRLTEEQELDFSYGHGTKARFRAHCFHKTTGLAAVFRAHSSKVPSLADLNASEGVRKLAERRSGLVLVTGPAGSGRSTTLAAMVDHINHTRRAHILTLEEPLEFVHEPVRAQVTHREVGTHAPSLATALRSAERENPDVLLIGELRTAEAMRQALRLAGSGVLVLATLTAPNALEALERILHAFPAEEQPRIRAMLAESLAGIVAQHLLRTTDDQGRVAAQEVLIGGGAIAALIREGQESQITSKMLSGTSQGMQTLDMHLAKLVGTDTLTPEAALEKAQDRESFARLLQQLKPDFVPPSDLKA